MLPPTPWRAGPQPSQRPWRRELVEQVAHLPDVDGIEREMVEVRGALADQRHHVVVGVDVEPDALLAETVAEPHPEHLGVEADAVVERAGEAVDMAELARRARAHASGRRACGDPRLALAVGQELDPEAIGIGEADRTVALLAGDPARVERARPPRRACSRARSSKPVWSCPGVPTRSARASRARPRRRARRAPPRSPRSSSPNSFAQRSACLVEVGDAQADVVDARAGGSRGVGSGREPRRLLLGHRQRDVDRVGRDLRAARRRRRGRRPTRRPCSRAGRGR